MSFKYEMKWILSEINTIQNLHQQNVYVHVIVTPHSNTRFHELYHTQL